MHIIEFEKKGTHYLPEDLSQCDTRQYIEMAALVLELQSGFLTYEEFRVHAFYKLLNMKPVKRNQVDEEKHSKIYQCSELINTFFETNEEKERVIKMHYINNPIPEFLNNVTIYVGPENEFNNVKFGEYVDALQYYIDFNDTKEPIYLYRLLAVMYRPKTLLYNLSYKRELYDESKVEKRSKLFKYQHIGIVYGFYLYFASFQKYVSSAKLFIQGNEIDLSVLFEQTSKKVKQSDLPGLGMKGVMFSMAESGVFGDLEKVRQAPLWEVLIRMYDIVKRNADEKAASETKKK